MTSRHREPPNTWPELIGHLFTLNERLAAADSGAIEAPRPPHVGASEADLLAAEAALGEPFDRDHRSFLRHANGWPAMNVTVDLLSTFDFCDDARTAELEEALALTLHPSSPVKPGDVYVIAAARMDRDLFVIGRRGTPTAGQVVWLAGDEIDRYPSYRDWILGTIALIQVDLDRFTRRGQINNGGCSINDGAEVRQWFVQ